MIRIQVPRLRLEIPGKGKAAQEHSPGERELGLRFLDFDLYCWGLNVYNK